MTYTGNHLIKNIDLQTIIDQISSYIYSKDTSGCYTYVNKSVQNLFGTSLDQIIGQDDSQFFALEITNEIKSNDSYVINHGVTIEREEKAIVKSSGEERIYWSVKRPLHNDQGQIIGMCGISTDITASKAMEKILQTKEQRLREAQHISQIGSWELDHITGESVWSDEIFRLLEIDTNLHLASLDSLLNAIHPEDLDAVKSAYLYPLETQEPYEITHRLLMSDGRIKWVTQRFSTSIDYESKPIRSLGTVQDVTERINADNALRIAAAAFETHEAIMITDAANTTILRVNRAFQKITGYSADEVVGKTPRILRSGPGQSRLNYSEDAK
jgi:PAS domain S-box-containing protein